MGNMERLIRREAGERGTSSAEGSRKLLRSVRGCHRDGRWLVLFAEDPVFLR